MKCKKCGNEMDAIHRLSSTWPGFKCRSCDEEHLIPLSKHLDNVMKKKMGLPEDYSTNNTGKEEK